MIGLTLPAFSRELPLNGRPVIMSSLQGAARTLGLDGVCVSTEAFVLRGPEVERYGRRSYLEALPARWVQLGFEVAPRVKVGFDHLFLLRSGAAVTVVLIRSGLGDLVLASCSVVTDRPASTSVLP